MNFLMSIRWRCHSCIRGEYTVGFSHSKSVISKTTTHSMLCGKLLVFLDYNCDFITSAALQLKELL